MRKSRQFRLRPVAVTKNGDASVALVDSVRILGSGRTVSGVGALVVMPATVTEIVPDVALGGRATVNCVAVAESTFRDTPFNVTTSALGIVLNPCPCIVNTPVWGTVCGERLKMVRPLEAVERLI